MRLLDEEMRRVLVYCSWRADWWRGQLGFRNDAEEPLTEGLKAYAEEHAIHALQQARSFSARWYAVRMEARGLIEKVFGASAVSEPLLPLDHDLQTLRLVIDTLDEEIDEAAIDSDFEE